jgi:hypothetical protein
MLGEIYPAFLTTRGIRQHSRTAGAMSMAAGECVSVDVQLRCGSSLKASL